jgi:hypothetical protein
MVRFSGFALGKPFSLEAKGPLELVQKKLGLSSEEPCFDYRMWIKILPASGQEAWQDVCISSLSEDIYEAALKLCQNKTEIIAIIRGKNESSPMSSQRGETRNDPKTPSKPQPGTPNGQDIQNALSTLSSDSTTEFTMAETFSIDKYIPQAVNKKEPFLLVDLSDPDVELIPLFFPIRKENLGFEVLLVDKSSLERFVEFELKKCRKPFNLSLRVDNCRGGRGRTFHFSPQVWIGSMLPNSACLRRVFSAVVTIEAIRTEQLKELQELDLFMKVQYWIADMFEFQTAAERLSCPNDSPDVAGLLSPYYFNMSEARYLGNLYVSMGDGEGKKAVTLKDFLNKLAAEEDNVCTSHNLAPKLQTMFDIRKGFHKDSSFEKERKTWLKAQASIWRGHPTSSAKL